MKDQLWERFVRLCMITGVVAGLAGISLEVKSQSTGYYTAPYYHHADRNQGPYPTAGEAITAWWAVWQMEYPGYGCGYNLTMEDPYQTGGWVASMLLQSPCGGGNGVTATFYSGYNPDKNLGPAQCDAPGTHCGNPINAAIGNKYQKEEDIPARGLLEFSRFYNSSPSANRSAFGYHWTHTYSQFIEVERNASNGTAAVSRPEGGRVQFALTNGQWVAGSGIRSSLVELKDSNGTTTGWLFSEIDGRRIESYDASGRLIEISDSEGHQVTLAYDPGAGSLNHLLLALAEDGRALSFTYDSSGRLASIADSSGAAYTYTYDNQNHLQSVIYPGGNSQRIYLYNESAYTGGVSQPYALTGIVDESGSRFATYQYNSSGQAISTEHGAGIDKYSVSYNTDGTSTVTKPLGDQETRAFATPQGVKKASSIADSNGTISYTYDSSGYPQQYTDARGTVTNYTYNASGQRIQEIDAANDATGKKRTIQTDWHTTFNVPIERRVLDANDVLVSRETWTYNTRGQVLTHSSIDPATNATRTTTTTYCEDSNTCGGIGLVTSVNGARTDVNDITNYSYYLSDDPSCASTPPTTCAHRKGDLWTATNALGQISETLAYDDAGRVLSVKDPNGVITDFTYTSRGWLASKTIRGGGAGPDRQTRIEYWPTGLVSFVYQPDNSFTAFTYDAAHRLTDVYDNAGNKIHYTLDNAGNRTKEDTSDSNGTLTRTLSRVYNQLGQLQQSLTANNHATTYAYDANGNTTGVSDALGHATGNAYDPLGRLIQTLQDTGGINASTQLAYDANDHLTQVIDPKGLATNYSYNGLGDLIQLVNPDTGTTGYTYDSAGNRLTQTDARGITATSAYDALNRLVSISYPDSTYNQSYTYDAVQSICPAGEQVAKGQLTAMQAKGATTKYCYDHWGQLVRKVQMVGSLTQVTRYAYDVYGRLQGLVYPDGGMVDYVRNALGQISEVGYTPVNGARSAIVTGATYAPFGPVTGWNYGNGRHLDRTLTLDYRPNTIYDNQPGGLSFAYGFDAAGNLGALKDATQTTDLGKFVYDGLNRLTQQQAGNGAVLNTWTYDATGNRLSSRAGSATVKNYSYLATSHRLDKVGSVVRAYDEVGNTANIGGAAKSFVYGPDNRMASVSASGTIKMNYGYDARGQEVRRSVGTTVYTYDYDEAGHLLGEYTGTGLANQQYIYVDDLPVAVVAGRGTTQAVHYIEPDHLGTPRTVIDGARNVAIWNWSLTGEAFGSSTPVTDPDGDGKTFTLNLRFPGQRYDSATGLNQNWNRDYESGTGRYAQSDPIGLAGGVSTYGYVGGNPANAIDPQGLFLTTVDAYCMQDPSGCADMFRDMARGAAQTQRQLGNECAAQGLDAVSDAADAVSPVLPLLALKGAGKSASAGNNLVYRSVNASGEVNYVGITNNLERRAAEHLRGKGIVIDGIPGLSNLSRADARSVEQALIDFHGLSKNGGTLLNKINSISTLNPAYSRSLQRGAELLKQAGYPGF